MPKSCEVNEETMKTTPIGRMRSEKTFIEPVVVAASAGAPRWATMTASETPTTTWADRQRHHDGPGQGQQDGGPGWWPRSRRGGRCREVDGLPDRVAGAHRAASLDSITSGG